MFIVPRPSDKVTQATRANRNRDILYLQILKLFYIYLCKQSVEGAKTTLADYTFVSQGRNFSVFELQLNHIWKV